jgi:hypothetical protein
MSVTKIFQQLSPKQENPIQSRSGLPAIVGPREPISEVLMPSLKKTKVEPRTERPQIPGYGISKSKTGMLPWEWAVKTLTDSREYWIVTVRSDGVSSGNSDPLDSGNSGTPKNLQKG